VAFDAMFLDVSMPGMNGLDVMAEVRRLRPSLRRRGDHGPRDGGRDRGRQEDWAQWM